MPVHTKDYFIFWLIPLIFLTIFYLRSFLLILFVSLIIGLAIQSWALILKNKFKLPFHLGVAVIYFLLILTFLLFLYLAVPIFLHQFQSLLDKLPDFYEDFFGQKEIPVPKFLSPILEKTSGVLFQFGPNLVFQLFGGVFSTILIAVISFYIAVNQKLLSSLTKIFLKNSDNEEKWIRFWDRVKERFGNWLGGEIILMFSVGLVTFLAMVFWGIPYAFVIGLSAGLFEIIPILGPFISGAIAVLITLASEPAKIIWVILTFVLIQQLENALLVPLVMKKAISLPPIITLLGVILGGKVGGIFGILVIVPAIAFSIEIYRALYPRKEIPQI